MKREIIISTLMFLICVPAHAQDFSCKEYQQKMTKGYYNFADPKLISGEVKPTRISYPVSKTDVRGTKSNEIVVFRDSTGVTEIQDNHYGGKLRSTMSMLENIGSLDVSLAPAYGQGQSVTFRTDANGRCYISKMEDLAFTKSGMTRKETYEQGLCQNLYSFRRDHTADFKECTELNIVGSGGVSSSMLVGQPSLMLQFRKDNQLFLQRCNSFKQQIRDALSTHYDLKLRETETELAERVLNQCDSLGANLVHLEQHHDSAPHSYGQDPVVTASTAN